jgi:hypothetical protein
MSPTGDSAAKFVTKDEASRIAANVAKLPVKQSPDRPPKR